MVRQVHKHDSQVGMPRRYSISTMLVLTTVFALLFGLLKVLDVPPGGFAAISIFVAGVVVCQALLFGGKNPRAASIVGGSVIFYITMVVVSLTNEFSPRDFTREITFSFLGIILDLFIGGLLGYLTGGLIAAIFLFHKEPDAELPESLYTGDKPSLLAQHEPDNSSKPPQGTSSPEVKGQ